MKYIEKMIETILFVICSLMVIFMFVQIVLRSLFDYSLQWADEFTRFGAIWTTFLGAALVIKERGHTKVDFFIRFLPASMFRYANVFLNLLLSVFITILIFNSITMVNEGMKQTTPALGIPYGLIILALPVGGVFMILYLLFDSIRWLKEREVE